MSSDGPGDGEGVAEAKFLVHSPHRIEVLRALRAGPLARSDLAERTDVSRVTLGRSLGEMETRRWLERADGQYRLLPLGEAVLGAVEPFLRTLSTAHRLRDVVEYLGVDELGFDLARLADARVVETTRHDSGSVVRRYLELVDAASELWVLKDTVDLSVARAVSDRIETGDLEVCVVYSPQAVETTRTIPEARELMRRDLANGKAAFRYPGRLTHHVALVDATVLLFLRDDRGLRGLVETDDPVVREWATHTIRRIRDDADPLDGSTFAAPEG